MAQSSTESQLSEDIQLGDVINNSRTAYTIEKFLGHGSYGTVVQCSESASTKKTAVKIVRKELSSDAVSEIAILEKLKELDETTHIVKYIDNFTHQDHVCLAFEMLDISLFDLMDNRSFEPLALPEIRDIAQQMLVALDALKSKQVVHSDIKPDNIMLVNHQSLPFKVKLIDFGLAVPTAGLLRGTVIQVPCFRAPEVILGVPMNEAVDMWSLACVLAFLYLGMLLYPPLCEYETMRVINQLQGKPEEHLLNIGLRTQNNFMKDEKSPHGFWRLMTPAEHRLKTGCELKPERGVYDRFRSLDDVVYSRKKARDGPQHRDSQAFISLLKGMLEINPAKRITPSEALQHDFITMKHLCDDTENNNNATPAHSTIKDCQQKQTMVEVISSEAVIQVRPYSAADDTTTDKDDGSSATYLSCDETSTTDLAVSSSANEESRKGAIVIHVRPYPGAEEITTDENDGTSATAAPATAAPDTADIAVKADEPPASVQPNLDDISSDSEEGTTGFVEVKTRKKWFKRIGRFFSRMIDSVTRCC